MMGAQVVPGNHCASVQWFRGSWWDEEYMKYEEVKMMALNNDCTYCGGLLGVLPSLE